MEEGNFISQSTTDICTVYNLFPSCQTTICLILQINSVALYNIPFFIRFKDILWILTPQCAWVLNHIRMFSLSFNSSLSQTCFILMHHYLFFQKAWNRTFYINQLIVTYHLAGPLGFCVTLINCSDNVNLNLWPCIPTSVSLGNGSHQQFLFLHILCNIYKCL